jgi:signal transduction histidine kinase
VWTNLIDNAVDAIQESGGSGGRIAIRVSAEPEWVTVEIEDDGAGIPASASQRVFDPFFTTKPPGKGTGLGLNLVYQIVVFDHGGDITFESAPGRTVFRVGLPVRAVR